MPAKGQNLLKARGVYFNKGAHTLSWEPLSGVQGAMARSPLSPVARWAAWGFVSLDIRFLSESTCENRLAETRRIRWKATGLNSYLFILFSVWPPHAAVVLVLELTPPGELGLLSAPLGKENSAGGFPAPRGTPGLSFPSTDRGDLRCSVHWSRCREQGGLGD